MTYCNGKGCALIMSCKRYRDGQRIIKNVARDTGQHSFVDFCDPETRNMYIGNII